VPAERRAEGARRAIAKALRDFFDAEVVPTKQITGCSSGYGLETARHFVERGWNVIATMRTPREDILPRSERVRVLALDVTRRESIESAIETCGAIDVLVNNAGIGVIGVFEATPMATVRDVFETNTFGVMARAGPDAVALAQARQG
jgi:NAD(P)-dependent dehydrogenase (short-subunit alcohol dehydrogenase family)